MVGISLGKGCSGLKSHLAELVMRADMRLCLGRWRILGFLPPWTGWIMSCVEDGPVYQLELYNFIVAVLFKNPTLVCRVTAPP